MGFALGNYFGRADRSGGCPVDQRTRSARTASRRIGCTAEEWLARRAAGLWWCSLGKHWTEERNLISRSACCACKRAAYYAAKSARPSLDHSSGPSTPEPKHPFQGDSRP